MKSLFILFALLSINTWAVCEKYPGKDYASLYSTGPEEDYLTFTQQLHKNLEVILIAAKSTCGAKACEYAGYIKNKNGCFQRVISFQGSFELGKSTSTFKPLIVNVPLENGQKKSCEWHYQPMAQKMIEVQSTCRMIK